MSAIDASDMNGHVGVDFDNENESPKQTMDPPKDKTVDRTEESKSNNQKNEMKAKNNSRQGSPPPFPQANSLSKETSLNHRVVHRIDVSALAHNYDCVSTAAEGQDCQVMVVVKADGYGHGAIETALSLHEAVGANAFAVATLEEAIALRKALQKQQLQMSANKTGTSTPSTPHVSSLFLPPPNLISAPSTLSTTTTGTTKNDESADQHVRILVLGPPIGYPRCFDDYYYYHIECMVSGPEVAQSLMDWVNDSGKRKSIIVEKVAMDLSNELTSAAAAPVPSSAGQPIRTPPPEAATSNENNPCKIPGQFHSTLSTVTGQDLAKEFRQLLLQKQSATKKQTMDISNNTDEQETLSSEQEGKQAKSPGENGKPDDKASDNRTQKSTTARKQRRKVRWHALVDSGMGRLGFRTDDHRIRQEAVSILQGLVKMEQPATTSEKTGSPNGGVPQESPVEFYGMCTHMADAHSTSDYTNRQIERFQSLLDEVRQAGIFVPTLSTDNSAALLTPSLKHFDPQKLLHPVSNGTEQSITSGYVRTGGAIYGQRAFPQLRPVSTLMASVRHVAVVPKGSSVGYDRAYIAPYHVRIATLTVGFADGYPRELGNGRGRVMIRDKIYRVAGNVCMDMMMVELGPCPDYVFSDDKDGEIIPLETSVSVDKSDSPVSVGDVAILWGSTGEISLAEIASQLKTTQSALTCGLDKTRVQREYISSMTK